MNSDLRAEPIGAYYFSSFLDIISVQIALSYIWMNSKLKGLSIEPRTPESKFGGEIYGRPKFEASYEQ